MFAAIHLPNLPIHAALLASPAAAGSPCAILSSPTGKHSKKNKAKLPLVALNDIALLTGILPGWPLHRALVRCPNLTLLPPSPTHEKHLLHELVEIADSLTPDFEITQPDTLILHLPTPSRQARLPFLDTSCTTLHHCIAATPDLAHLGVLHPSTLNRTITPADLIPIPLHHLQALPHTAKTLPTLLSWGLRTLGDFMKLPAHGLAERLGPSALHHHQLLHGLIQRRLHLHHPSPSFSTSFDLESPVSTTEPLVFCLKNLTQTLSFRLLHHHLAAQSLTLTLHLTSAATLTRTLHFPEPRLQPNDLLNPLHSLLHSLQLPSPVQSLTLTASPTPPTATQLDPFQRQLPHPQRWQDTLTQLENLLGHDNVGIPLPPQSYLEDNPRLLPAPTTMPKKTATPFNDTSWIPPHSLPLHRFRPPHPIHVASRHGPHPLALLTGPFRGPITALRGPFRFSNHWWDQEKTSRALEWDIQLPPHTLLRLSFSPPDRWLLLGTYSPPHSP